MRALVSILLALLLLACGPQSAADTGTVRDSGTDGGVVRDSRVPSDTNPGADTSTQADTATGTDGGVDAAPDSAVACDAPRVDTSSPPASASWRFGGGVGYPDRPPSVGDCVTRVDDRASLEAALSSATNGDVVWVESDARIDLTGAPVVCIPAGVTLASDRGIEGRPGGLIYVETTVSQDTLRACGDDVRVSGLRLYGHESTQCPDEWLSSGHSACTGDIAGDVNCRDCMPRSRGIRALDVDRLEVDNCELAGWTYGAIELIRSHDNLVHHNEIHHNQRQGLGYGVVESGIANDADVLITFNRFDYNRHSVAGSGGIGQSYEARDNLVLEHANGHVFDMHGISESSSWVESTHGPIDVAGTNLNIHRNTVLTTSAAALVVRGRPTEGAWFYDNCLAAGSASSAARQTRYTGRFYVDQSPSGSAPNSYGQAPSDCEPRRFCVSSGGAGPWRYLSRSGFGLSALALGDFDGDGRADVLRPDGTVWHWLSGGTGGWATLNTQTDRLDALAFGDFDGDGRTDAFRTTGSEWQWSSGASAPFVRRNVSGAVLADLGFGDFDGDGETDVFWSSGGEWRVSYSGSGSWTVVNTSSTPVAQLAFADFDGDGADDVFRATGSAWQVSYGASSSWTTVNSSSITLPALRFADVNGDRRADAIRLSRDRWNVSYGASSSWQPLTYRSVPLGEIAFADLDGDGTDDAFQTGCL